MDVCCDCCVFSGRSLCDELITRPEESYRLRCVVVCDLEISWMRRPWPTGGSCAKIKKTNFKRKFKFLFIGNLTNETALNVGICYRQLTNITLHYITLHYITLHYITLHYITNLWNEIFLQLLRVSSNGLRKRERWNEKALCVFERSCQLLRFHKWNISTRQWWNDTGS
jgi:hypothetical protein